MSKLMAIAACFMLCAGSYAVGRYQGFHAGTYVGTSLGIDMLYRQVRCIDWGNGCVDQKPAAAANRKDDESYRWWKINGGVHIEP